MKVKLSKMKVKLHHTQPFLETNNFEDRPGYYLISLKWSLINEEYITFVRKDALRAGKIKTKTGNFPLHGSSKHCSNHPTKDSP